MIVYILLTALLHTFFTALFEDEIFIVTFFSFYFFKNFYEKTKTKILFAGFTLRPRMEKDNGKVFFKEFTKKQSRQLSRDCAENFLDLVTPLCGSSE